MESYDVHPMEIGCKHFRKINVVGSYYLFFRTLLMSAVCPTGSLCKKLRTIFNFYLFSNFDDRGAVARYVASVRSDSTHARGLRYTKHRARDF